MPWAKTAKGHHDNYPDNRAFGWDRGSTTGCEDKVLFFLDYLSCKLSPGPVEEFWKNHNRYKITNLASKHGGMHLRQIMFTLAGVTDRGITNLLNFSSRRKVCLILPLLTMYRVEVGLSPFEQRTNHRELAGSAFSLLVFSQILGGNRLWVSLGFTFEPM